MMAREIYLEDEFKPIVAKVSEVLTPQLKAYSDGLITGVHYQFGHPLEIIETLKQNQEGNMAAFDRYPLVAFFLDDTSVERGLKPGIYGEHSLHLAIIAASMPDWKAEERKERNFKPVLGPIYRELFNQIGSRGDLFHVGNVEMIPHKPIRRYYWGREGLWGNEGNIFNDAVDCIEIIGLKLKTDINYCPKPAV